MLFRPSRPDFIETSFRRLLAVASMSLFRPSRPDFIETTIGGTMGSVELATCSGLLGRTSLRLALLGRQPADVILVPAF